MIRTISQLFLKARGTSIFIAMSVSVAAFAVISGSSGVVASPSKTLSSTQTNDIISGKVTDDSGRPLDSAGVTLVQQGATHNRVETLTTDENGSFTFKHVEPGNYNISAIYNGYADEYFVSAGNKERQLYSPGDHVAIRMIKGGAITGKVVDQQGRPVASMSVFAFRNSDPAGHKCSTGWVSALTDDRGVYRIFGLLPGSYIVEATGKQTSYLNPVNRFFFCVPTYYPSSAINKTEQVVVASAGETTGINIIFRDIPGRRISGTVTNPKWIPHSFVEIRLKHLGSNYEGDLIAVRYEDQGHSFEFLRLEDGDYELTASYQSGGKLVSRTEKPVVVSVKGGNVAGINLALY
ncbi:MAG TPA: carboxypeptidase-like regulatory domain-containing protein [Blastocatellia bacterium]|nr:carboxypeptidase-like regulatory domain-containing protein [Blastocatellia bacterium]